MIIVGLTGSIGMGKSDTAKMFCRLGVPVFDSDKEVHRLTAPGGGGMGDIEEAFPDLVRQGRLDRGALGARAFQNPQILGKLEQILHPLVIRAQKRFLMRQARIKTPMVVLDIPLLFETGLDRLCDKVVTVTASAEVQRQRVLGRPGMSERKFERIVASQTTDQEKQNRSDLVIRTDKGRGAVYCAVRAFIRRQRLARGGAFRRWKAAKAEPIMRQGRRPIASLRELS